jgi:hypothetical protein
MRGMEAEWKEKLGIEIEAKWKRDRSERLSVRTLY